MVREHFVLVNITLLVSKYQTRKACVIDLSGGEEAVGKSSSKNVRKGHSCAPVSLYVMHCAKEKLNRIRRWLKLPVCWYPSISRLYIKIRGEKYQ